MRRHIRHRYVLSEWTPGDEKLLRAVKHGAVADVETLVVGKGVNPTKVDPNRGTTALHLSASKGFAEIVEIFLSRPIDVNVRDVTGRTAVQCAARHAHHDVTDRLLQSGADVNVVDHDGWSPLHHACLGGCINCVQLLLMYGASPHMKDKFGRTALVCAVSNGQASLCRLLLENGADVNESDFNAKTALMLAAAKGNAHLCEYLIRNGADVNHADNQGRNALWYSTAANFQDVCKLLRRKMRSRTIASRGLKYERIVEEDPTQDNSSGRRSTTSGGQADDLLGGDATVSLDDQMTQTTEESSDIIDPPEQFRLIPVGTAQQSDACHVTSDVSIALVRYVSSDACEPRLAELNDENQILNIQIEELLTATALLVLIRRSLGANCRRIRSYLRWIYVELLRLHGYLETVRRDLTSSSSVDRCAWTTLGRRIQLVVYFLQSLVRLNEIRALFDETAGRRPSSKYPKLGDPARLAKPRLGSATTSSSDDGRIDERTTVTAADDGVRIRQEISEGVSAISSLIISNGGVCPSDDVDVIVTRDPTGGVDPKDVTDDSCFGAVDSQRTRSETTESCEQLTRSDKSSQQLVQAAALDFAAADEVNRELFSDDEKSKSDFVRHLDHTYVGEESDTNMSAEKLCSMELTTLNKDSDDQNAGPTEKYEELSAREHAFTHASADESGNVLTAQGQHDKELCGKKTSEEFVKPLSSERMSTSTELGVDAVDHPKTSDKTSIKYAIANNSTIFIAAEAEPNEASRSRAVNVKSMSHRFVSHDAEEREHAKQLQKRIAGLRSKLTEKSAQVEYLSEKLEHANGRLDNQVAQFRSAVAVLESVYLSKLEAMENKFIEIEQFVQGIATSDDPKSSAINLSSVDDDDTGVDLSISETITVGDNYIGGLRIGDISTGKSSARRRDSNYNIPEITMEEELLTDEAFTKPSIDANIDARLIPSRCPADMQHDASENAVGASVPSDSRREQRATEKRDAHVESNEYSYRVDDRLTHDVIGMQKIYIDDLLEEIAAMERTIQEQARYLSINADDGHRAATLSSATDDRYINGETKNVATIQSFELEEDRALRADIEVSLHVARSMSSAVELSVDAAESNAVCMKTPNADTRRQHPTSFHSQCVPPQQIEQHRLEPLTQSARSTADRRGHDGPTVESSTSFLRHSINSGQSSKSWPSDTDQDSMLNPSRQNNDDDTACMAAHGRHRHPPDIIASNNSCTVEATSEEHDDRRRRLEVEAARRLGEQLCKLCSLLRRGDYVGILSVAGEGFFDSSDDLLFVVGQFRRLLSEKSMLEDRVRLLDDEVDGLVDELWRQERRDRKLPIIVEEDDREAEQLRKTIEFKDRELVVLRTALTEHVGLVNDLRSSVAGLEMALEARNDLEEKLSTAEYELEEMRQELALQRVSELAAKSTEQEMDRALATALTGIDRAVSSDSTPAVAEGHRKFLIEKQFDDRLGDADVEYYTLFQRPEAEPGNSTARDVRIHHGQVLFDKFGLLQPDEVSYGEKQLRIGATRRLDFEECSSNTETGVYLSGNIECVDGSAADITEGDIYSRDAAVRTSATASFVEPEIADFIPADQFTACDRIQQQQAVRSSDDLQVSQPITGELHFANIDTSNQSRQPNESVHQISGPELHGFCQKLNEGVDDPNYGSRVSPTSSEIYEQLVARADYLKRENDRLTREVEKLKMILEMEKLKKFPAVDDSPAAAASTSAATVSDMDRGEEEAQVKQSYSDEDVSFWSRSARHDIRSSVDSSSAYWNPSYSPTLSTVVRQVVSEDEIEEEEEVEQHQQRYDSSVQRDSVRRIQSVDGIRRASSYADDQQRPQHVGRAADVGATWWQRDSTMSAAEYRTQTLDVLTSRRRRMTSYDAGGPVSADRWLPTSADDWDHHRRTVRPSAPTSSDLVRQMRVENAKLERFIDVMSEHLDRRRRHHHRPAATTGDSLLTTMSRVTSEQTTTMTSSSFDEESFEQQLQQLPSPPPPPQLCTDAADEAVRSSVEVELQRQDPSISDLLEDVSHSFERRQRTVCASRESDAVASGCSSVPARAAARCSLTDSVDSLLAGGEPEETTVHAPLDRVVESDAALVAELRAQLQDSERKHQSIVDKYRSHLLAAAQGRLNPALRDALMNVIESHQKSEVDKPAE